MGFRILLWQDRLKKIGCAGLKGEVLPGFHFQTNAIWRMTEMTQFLRLFGALAAQGQRATKTKMLVKLSYSAVFLAFGLAFVFLATIFAGAASAFTGVASTLAAIAFSAVIATLNAPRVSSKVALTRSF